MKKNFRVVTMGILFIGMTLLVGCKKEDKIERNLWAKGGEWNVDRWYLEQNEEFNSEFIEDQTYIQDVIDCGTFTFKKDGTGNFKVNLDGDVFYEEFTYENTENKLFLEFKGDWNDDFTYYGKGVDMTFIIDWRKNSLEMFYQYWDSYPTSSGNSHTIKENHKINLSKKK